MKYSIKSIYDKISAMIILISVTIIAAGCVLGVHYLNVYQFYDNSGEYARRVAWMDKMKETEAEIEDYLFASLNKDHGKYEKILEDYNNKFEKSNVDFFIYDSDGNRILSNRSEDYVFNAENYQFDYEKNYAIGDKTGTIALYLRNDLTENDSYRVADQFIRIGNSLKYVVIVVLILTISVILVMLSLIAFGAGEQKEDGQVSVGFIDKLPFDVCTLGFVATLAAAWLCIKLTQIADSNIVLLNVVVFFVVIIMVMILLFYLSTFSVRIKLGNLFQNTLIYRFCNLISRKLTRFKRLKKYQKQKKDKIQKKAKNPYYRNLVVAVILLTLVELSVILFFLHQDHQNRLNFMYYVFYWVISRVISIPIIVVAAMNLAYAYNTSKRLAEGNLDELGETAFMFKGFRMYNNNLEQIRKEISKSLESEMKNERLKNEMITNLSHDIKTPLTSIISYVSLLKDPNNSPEDEKAYIEVIDRQSLKLKKLLENLIESSKLSKGEIAVEKETMNVGLILSQAAGEFQYMLEEHQLKLVCDEVETSACISADGNLLWRILSNLMSNICKYAKTGTEVYLNLDITDDKVKFILRNTSDKPITTDGDELLERFVRDDSSRHTEGDGLGLSIAKRLTEIQGGTMELSVDESLFEIALVFDRIYE